MSDSSPAPASVKRATIARALQLPRLSGKASAAWLIICFVLTALLIPLVLGLPKWIEFEIALATWWLIWLVVLTRLLYVGSQVSDDHRMGEPRNWFASLGSFGNNDRSAKRSRSSGSWSDGFFWGFMAADSEAVAAGCLIVVGLIVLAGAIWFLIEIAVPLIAFLAYLLTRGMLAHAVNDRHHCRGDLARSLTWSFVWATIYVAPLAGAVWFVHFVHNRQPTM